MSQKFSRWIGVPRPSHVSRALIWAQGKSNTSSWCNPNQTVLPGEGPSWVVGNVNPLGQKMELNKGSPHSKWVFNPLTKTKCCFIGDFLVFVLLFLHNFLISNFLGSIVLFEATWILCFHSALLKYFCTSLHQRCYSVSDLQISYQSCHHLSVCLKSLSNFTEQYHTVLHDKQFRCCLSWLWKWALSPSKTFRIIVYYNKVVKWG